MSTKQARVEVYINDDQAQAKLADIQAELKQVKVMRDKAAAAGDVKGFVQLQNETKKLTREANQLQKKVIDVRAVLNDLNGSSVKDLRDALRKTNAELDRMKRNDAGFAEKKKQAALLSDELNRINSESKKSGVTLGGVADGFNKYFGMLTTLVASLTGVVIGIKKAIESFNDFEERADNLQALTGLAGDALDWLTERAKNLSTAMLEGGVKVKQSAIEIIDAFTKTGSARPELLKNKEALSAVTEEAIILANASKEELQPAIEALTMVMNQYNAPASEARRIINALAAGSMEGAGEIPYLTTAFEKAGTVAADAGISIETLVATLETLAPRMTAPEIAGRSLKGVLLDLQTTSDDTNPAIVGLSTALTNLAAKNLTMIELTKLFGTENITTAKILLNNVDELKYYEKAVTGTNIAIEQATTNTQNNNASLAQAKNRLNLLSMELGEKLAPAFTFSTNSASYLIKALSVLVNFAVKYGTVLATTTAAIVGYTVATKIAVMWEARANKEKISTIILTKLQALATHAQTAAIALYNAAVALLTGNLAVASIQLRAFTAALLAHPIGLIVGAVAALATGIYFLTARLSNAEKAYRMMSKVSLDAKKNIVAEKVEIEGLLRIAKSRTLSDKDRIAAIEKLNEISPEYLKDITLETINTKEAKTAIDDYILSLERKAKVQAATEKLIEIEKKLLDLQADDAGKPSLWQQSLNFVLGGGNAYNQLLLNAKTQVSNLKNETELLNIQKSKLLGITKKEEVAAVVNKNDDGEEKTKLVELIKLQEDALNVAKQMPTSTEAEIAARNKKVQSIELEIKRLNELGKVAQTDEFKPEKYEKWQKKANALAKKKEEFSKKAQKDYFKDNDKFWDDYLDKRHTKDITKLIKTQTKELIVLNDRFAKGLISEKEYNAESLRIKQKFENDSLLLAIDKAQRELAILRLSGKDIVEQEKILADLRLQAEQVKAPDKKTKDKSKITAEEKKEYALNAAADVADAVFNMRANARQAELDAELSNLDRLRDAELKNKNLTEAQKDAINEKYRKREAAIKLETWKKDKQAAILQATINGALAITKTFAIYGFGIASWWAAAAQAVATGAQIAIIAAQKPPQYKAGGYTPTDASDDTPVGVVHANEFVANAQAARNPTVRPVLDIMKRAQESGAIRTINLPAAIAASNLPGLKAGGYTSSGSSDRFPDAGNMMAAVVRFEKAVQQLQDKGVEAKLIYQDFKKMADKEAKAINRTK